MNAPDGRAVDSDGTAPSAAPSASPLPVFLAAFALWGGTLFYFCGFRLGQPPPTWGSWAALVLTVVFLALGLATLCTLVSISATRLLRAHRWPRVFDLAQALLLGFAAGWAVLSLAKFHATRAHLNWLDLRFILGSLAQVGAEASAEELRLLWTALVLPLLVAAVAYLGLRLGSRRSGGAAVTVGSLAALLGVAAAGLLTLALRQTYARFVLTTVAPGTSWGVRQIVGADSLGGAQPRAFVPDPARHSRIVPYAAPAEFRRANVVVLMLESIPWARLFGPFARPESTPRLLELAGRSVVFDRAYAVATHSDYAQTSILASLHPRRLDRHDFFVDIAYPRTLPWDLLQPLGYRTAVFSCQNEGWANMRGFLETPRLELFRHAPDWPDAPRRGDEATSKVFEPAPIASFLSWVDAAPKRPFVAYLNFQATHYPYVVPPGAREPYRPAEIDFGTTFVSYPHDRIPVMENRFHNALAYVDGQVGRLVDGLAAAGVWENTILLVVSDHGEAFYEHGMPTHGSTLHEEQLRTAMFLRLPGEPARRVSAAVSVLDALPSIVAWMGLPEHGNFQGRSDVLSDSYESPAGSSRAFPFTIQGMTREDALLLDNWKFIVNWDRGARALYELDRDPGERRNLAESEPDKASEMERALTNLLLDQLAYYRERGWEKGYYPPKLP